MPSLASMDRQKEFVLRTLEERDIRFVRLWFTDVLGYLKSVAIAPAELEGAFEEGIGFDGSAIEGFSRVSEADTVAKPDASTFQVLPWASSKGHQHSARMFCDIAMPDGSPSWADSRHVLRRQLNKAGDLGFSCYVHPEIEFFLLENGPMDGTPPVPADSGGYFDQAVHDSAPNFRRHAIDALESMGISVEFSHHEAAPGQQEIDLRYADALSMADNVMTFRYVVKEVAIQEGVRASFMPKPFSDQAGSAMHTHMSLFEGDTNAFHNPDDPMQLSETGKAFIAGILEHANEISAVTNQWVNSYKRLVHGSEAPTAASWGPSNRSALIRVPMYTPNKASSRRVEIRSPDSACNPYLTFAVLLAAGLRGIEKGYELPPEAEDDVWSLTPAERRAMGYRELPQNLDQALREMEKSELVAEALGEHVFDFFLRNKRREWEDYRSNVTPYELKAYLGL
ncbi:glutamine synthetase [Rhodococcus triatomae]|uniref:Glutamine synthetase n=2 Tax=Rhodococcus triatomae TaxID=300028 RepID=A0A1G8D9P5_9NOCA|nr:glutamine synthetase [Rhodococcus triatomae]